MESRLREIIVSITNRCNLRCAMCQIPQLESDSEMTTAELKDLIKDTINLNPNSIVFSGGEPLLRKDIFELISFTNRQRINTCLTSNGTLINDRVARELRACGVGVVNISIEGPGNVHDSLRGRGAFKKALEALENLSRYKIETTLATVVCRQNYKFLPFVMNLAKRFGVTTVKFQPFSDIFLLEKDGKTNFFSTEKTLKEIEQNIEKVINLSYKYRISTNPVNYLRNIPKYLSGLWQQGSCHGCLALWNSCPISAEGNVYICWVLSDFMLGNVRKNRLSQIWNSEEHNQMRDLVQKKGCTGCLMSCYDYNFGKYDLEKIVHFKTQKFMKPKFYKRQYFRFYQNLRYVFKKIENQIFNLSPFSKKEIPELSDILMDIKSARETLKKELKNIEKNE